MAAVKFEQNENNAGAFTVNDEGKKLGEMVVDIKEGRLTVYHTEVAPEAEGKGYAKELLDNMVEYARKNNLQVIPYCPFVTAQFRRHQEEYADVWKKGEQ
jgi:uncharacterized protein